MTRSSVPGPVDHAALPYRIAVLCYLHDEAGRTLLLHRLREPNRGMYSPIGGKLDVEAGESPHDCALREIREETGLVLADGDVRLIGIVAETAYQNETHWLIFLFEVTRPLRHGEITRFEFDEGTLEWVEPERLGELAIPASDREIIWPLLDAHRGGFFMIHIDCRDGTMHVRVQESTKAESGGGPRFQGPRKGV